MADKQVIPSATDRPVGFAPQTTDVPSIFSLRASPTLADDLTAALSAKSWIRVSAPTVPDSLVATARLAAQEFFSQPTEKKLSVEIRKSRNHRGYVGITEKGDYPDEGGVRRYEAFDVGRDLPLDHPRVLAETPLLGPNQWPDIIGFPDATRRLYDAFDNTSRSILDLIEHGLGLAAGSIAVHRTEPLSQMRYLNYNEPDANAERHVAMGAHTDYEFITLIACSDAGGAGLQVAVDGEWVDVPAIPGTLIVMAGDLLETISNGRIPAALHRVSRMAGRRLTIPFFAAADYHAEVSPAPELVGPDGPKRESIQAGVHLLTQLQRDFPYLRDRVKTDGVGSADALHQLSRFEQRRLGHIQ